ncbi:MAG TPA: TonB-dependent receptor [Hyphomonadaceae bacterium]|nr:TonB-dependent receptor [Hyphomonadaceae bacterium]
MKLFSKLAALTSCSAISLGMLAPAIAQQASGPQQASPPQTTATQTTTTQAAADETVVVNGFRAGLANARDIARNSDNLVDVSSADDVGELPDQNIAEALRRLDSVYLIRDQGEGRYVSIRGIDPILNNVTMNGQTIAVSDTDGESGRAAPLDVLSSSALSRVEIHKVTLPNMDAQSIGGTINIVTPSGFDYKNGYFSSSMEYGVNDFNQDNNIYSANLSYSRRFGDNEEFALFVGGEYWYKEFTSQQYTASALFGNGTAGLPAHYYLPGTMVFAQSIGEKTRYGINANLEWRPNDDLKAWVRYYFTQYNDYRDRPQVTLTTQGTRVATSPNEFFAQRYTSSMETRSELQERPVQQLVFGGDYKLSDSWDITADLNYTTAKEVNPYQRYFQSTGVTANAASGVSPGAITITVDGDGLARPTAFDTTVSGGLTFMDPGFERITAFRGVSSDVLEEAYTGNVDLTWTGEFGGRAIELSTGAKAIIRDKSVNDTDYRYFPLTGQTYLLNSAPGLTSNFADGRGNPFGLVPGLNLIAPSRQGYEDYFFRNPGNFFYDDPSSRANSIENDYSLNENILAAYVMGNYHITDDLSVIAGVRVESTDEDISAQGFVAAANRDSSIPVGQSRLPFATSDIIDVSHTHSYTNVLPGISMRWDIAKDWLFRASATTNIGRPDYVDLAPITTIVVSETCAAPVLPGQTCTGGTLLDASIEIGNPDLKPYEGTNFDASLDYYFPDNSGAVTVGAFYKKLKNAVYSIQNQGEDFDFNGIHYDTYFQETVANSGDGYVQGIELSLQKDFTFLPAPFDGLGVYANAALIDSEVEIDVGDFGAPILRKVPFFNQADEIYNAQLYYEKGGLSARIAYSLQGDATSSAFSANPDMDSYRSPREAVDARIAYTFDNDVQVSLTGSNLTDHKALNYRGSEFFVSSYEQFGREFRLTVTKKW